MPREEEKGSIFPVLEERLGPGKRIYFPGTNNEDPHENDRILAQFIRRCFHDYGKKLVLEDITGPDDDTLSLECRTLVRQ